MNSWCTDEVMNYELVELTHRVKTRTTLSLHTRSHNFVVHLAAQCASARNLERAFLISLLAQIGKLPLIGDCRDLDQIWASK